MPADALNQLFRRIRLQPGVTRGELLEELGWSRVTVNRRLAELQDAGFIASAGQKESTGGRPPEGFVLNADHGLLLAADIGGSETRVMVADFAGEPLVVYGRALDVSEGPSRVLGWVRTQFRRLISQAGRTAADVVAIGIGVPGPVNFTEGRIVRPPTMPGWNGIQPGVFFSGEYPDAAIVVDHDANTLALGERRRVWPDRDNLVMIKIGYGLSCGLILDGQIHRGGVGMAGELGHLYTSEGTMCRCGRFGCLESVASGWAIQSELASIGRNVTSSSDVVDLARSGDSTAGRLLSTAGELIGRALATVVCLVNPSTIVMSGTLVRAGEVLTGPLRREIRNRTPNYLLDSLDILPTRLGDDAGLIGAALLAQDAAPVSEGVGQLLTNQEDPPT